MIISMEGRTKIDGAIPEVLTELTFVIRAVYEPLSEKMGEEQALDMIARAGRLAVMSDEEVEQETKDLIEKVLGGLE